MSIGISLGPTVSCTVAKCCLWITGYINILWHDFWPTHCTCGNEVSPHFFLPFAFTVTACYEWIVNGAVVFSLCWALSGGSDGKHAGRRSTWEVNAAVRRTQLTQLLSTRYTCCRPRSAQLSDTRIRHSCQAPYLQVQARGQLERSLLLTSYCLLLTFYYLLFTTCFLLLTTYY